MAPTDTPIRILYLAAFRDRAGRSEEAVTPPDTVRTGGALVAWLRARGGREADALAHAAILRCAVNRRFARDASPVGAGDEVAFFPPVTGG